MESSKQKRFKCQLCEKDFNNKSEQDRHVKIIHENEKIKCSKCGDNFDSKSSFEGTKV